MSQETVTVPMKTASRTQIKTLMSVRRDKMFGVVEILALGVSCLVLLMVLSSYLYFLLPARSRLASLQAEQVQLKTNIQQAQSIVSHDRDTQQTVDRIATSLENFESAGLISREAGRTELYDELNQLITKNGLRNTSGPTYTALDPAGSKPITGKSNSTKWQSYYPGIAVDVTVEGSYQALRHFIRDVEASKQFVVINQVELQRATNSNSTVSPDQAPANARSLVSLQLNMTTYFQRSGSAGNDVGGQVQ